MTTGLDMFPCAASHNIAHPVPAEAIFACQRSNTDAPVVVSSANVKDIGGSQFGTSYQLAPILATLGDHVVNVVSDGSGKAMCWVDAARVVPIRAVVANKHAVRDRSMVQRIREAMGQLASHVGVRMSARIEPPITVVVNHPSPQPTTVGVVAIDVRPKPGNATVGVILSGHFANLLHRLGECRSPDGGCRRGVSSCSNYTMGRA